jgi:hypothetical protein
VSPREIPASPSESTIWCGIFGIIRIGISVSTQKSIPKIIDDGKIAIGMFMMNKMELLLSPEPSKS